MKSLDRQISRQPDVLLGPAGTIAAYTHCLKQDLPSSVVKTMILRLDSVEKQTIGKSQFSPCQWLCLQARKFDGSEFNIWLLLSRCSTLKADPSIGSGLEDYQVVRYILHPADGSPIEFRNKLTGLAVLPSLGCWPHLIPQPIETEMSDGIFPPKLKYLGHHYRLESLDQAGGPFVPPAAQICTLTTDVLIGPAHNTKQKNPTRRYDRSDYELVRLTQSDYHQMIAAGINCLRVDSDQVQWVDSSDAFYWGISGTEINYPEDLYRSNYLGPTIFIDEPAVVCRDHVIRPKLKRDQLFRQTLTPQVALEDFRGHFHQAKYRGAPVRLINELSSRPDVDLGEMRFFQQNIYSWETMVSSAIYQLAEGASNPDANAGQVPSAMVFEPPGRFGTRRTLPEMNMAYGCQIPVDDPKNLASIIYGFLRGAARSTGKDWGMSIYGAVERADTFWLQTHAYDLGAKFFLYWDSYELACVPYDECLAMSTNLRAHAERHPQRDLDKLKQAAEVAILLPAGYNLGHVYMGKGNLWGLDELNLERLNREGVKYRQVMRNFFTEIERCLRLGVAFDLVWDMDGLNLSGYREVVRIREDGIVAVDQAGDHTLHSQARPPVRPQGAPPQVTVELFSDQDQSEGEITARATVLEGSSTVYYTTGTDERGISNNVVVSWELYGPEETDYRFLYWENAKPRISRRSSSEYQVEIDFSLNAVGDYRLRVATVDLAGRTAVAWEPVSLMGKSGQT